MPVTHFLIPPARRFAEGSFSAHLGRMRTVDECPVSGGGDPIPNVADGAKQPLRAGVSYPCFLPFVELRSGPTGQTLQAGHAARVLV